MESAEDTRASSQRRISFESESARDPRRKQGRSTRWLKMLAAVLLVVCLVSGVFIYTRSQATKVVTSQSGWCALSGVAQNDSLNLLHLASASSTNAWAFGTIAQGGASGSIQLVPLFEHWNGAQWSTVPTADKIGRAHV